MNAQESFRPNDGYSRTEIDLKLQTILMEIKSEMKDMRSDMNNFRSEIKSEMKDMRSDMNNFRSEIKSEIQSFRSEVKEELLQMNTRISVLDEKFSSQNKLIWIILGVLLSLILTIVTKSLFHLP